MRTRETQSPAKHNATPLLANSGNRNPRNVPDETLAELASITATNMKAIRTAPPAPAKEGEKPVIIARASRFERARKSPAVVWTLILCASVVIMVILPLIHVAVSTVGSPFNVLAQSGVAGANVEDACIYHTVLAGETLQSLSDDYGVSVASIASANNISNGATLEADQRLCMPPLGTSTRGQSGNIKADPSKSGSAQGEAAFVAFVLPYARRAHDDTGWPLSVILAQWGLEQGWKTPSFVGYNFGNCGAVPDEPMVPGTSAPGSPNNFAYAATPNDGLRIYLHVAHLSYYDAIAPAAKKGADAAAKALGASPWDAGHYTGTDNPGSSLLGVLQTFDLYKYDK